ncbi:phage tail terminator family protein [Paenibacillus sp. IHBB 3054]|uniref:phage tail terminator family protein n=1 Tax=Paenibacillus sp. IHBB 3054 TaxID=3425689 RepID=UPI003F67D432
MQDIKNALIKKLSLFTPELPVYDEAVEQGMQQPCFFVLLIESSQNREINRRYRRFNPFDVHYFPHKDAAAPREECELMAERLYSEIEYVRGSEGGYRGTGMRHEIVDGVLHFFVQYNYHVIRTKDPDIKMQSMTQGGGIK